MSPLSSAAHVIANPPLFPSPIEKTLFLNCAENGEAYIYHELKAHIEDSVSGLNAEATEHVKYDRELMGGTATPGTTSETIDKQLKNIETNDKKRK